MKESTVFPFVRIVGQEEMKKALLLNVLDPKIGGVLIRGEKGTAKSTTVRSLVQILPEVVSSKGCRFNCDPASPKNMCDECVTGYKDGELEEVARNMKVVELPLNATEDRVSGSLNIEHILTTGKRMFEGGVLAEANGNVLYVDEVNLLDDHIVDLLLDSAAMGRNYVEREGVSFSHPSRFILVGTMNPEEGSLRPQLLDRFGMCVDIKGERNADTRLKVIKSRLEYDEDPEKFIEDSMEETLALKKRLTEAREDLKKVTMSDDVMNIITRTAIKYGMEGHRSDIAMVRAAKANAALNGRNEVTREDIAETAGSVLRHRIKSGPFEEASFKQEEFLRWIRGY